MTSSSVELWKAAIRSDNLSDAQVSRMLVLSFVMPFYGAERAPRVFEALQSSFAKLTLETKHSARQNALQRSHLSTVAENGNPDALWRELDLSNVSYDAAGPIFKWQKHPQFTQSAALYKEFTELIGSSSGESALPLYLLLGAKNFARVLHARNGPFDSLYRTHSETLERFVSERVLPNPQYIAEVGYVLSLSRFPEAYLRSALQLEQLSKSTLYSRARELAREISRLEIGEMPANGRSLLAAPLADLRKAELRSLVPQLEELRAYCVANQLPAATQQQRARSAVEQAYARYEAAVENCRQDKVYAAKRAGELLRYELPKSLSSLSTEQLKSVSAELATLANTLEESFMS
jgi:hypothetical protein